MAIANGASMPIFATVQPQGSIAFYQTLISGLSSEVTASRPPSYHVALVGAALKIPKKINDPTIEFSRKPTPPPPKKKKKKQHLPRSAN